VNEDFAAVDLLPLLFFTALVVYVLAFGSADLARSLIRIAALAGAAICLAVWGVAAFAYEDWGGPIIDDFYATAIMERWLGTLWTAGSLLAISAVPAFFCLREVWALGTRRRQQ